MGYESHIRDEYWNEMKELLKQKTSHQCVIWATDNNGQVQKDQEQENWNSVGKWTYSNKTAQGNDKKLKILRKSQLAATDTHLMPKNQDKSHLITCQSAEDGAKKQHDYIMTDKNITIG